MENGKGGIKLSTDSFHHGCCGFDGDGRGGSRGRPCHGCGFIRQIENKCPTISFISDACPMNKEALIER